MNIPVDDQQIKQAYDHLKATRTTLSQAYEGARLARLTYEDAKAGIIRSTTDPKSLGQNEAARNANIDSVLEDQVQAARESETAEITARLEHDLAQIDVKCVESLLAWMAQFK